MLSCLFIPTAAHATYFFTAAGYISWYSGEGKVGLIGQANEDEREEFDKIRGVI